MRWNCRSWNERGIGWSISGFLHCRSLGLSSSNSLAVCFEGSLCWATRWRNGLNHLLWLVGDWNCMVTVAWINLLPSNKIDIKYNISSSNLQYKAKSRSVAQVTSFGRHPWLHSCTLWMLYLLDSFPYVVHYRTLTSQHHTAHCSLIIFFVVVLDLVFS